MVVATAAGEVLMMERTQPRGFWQSVTGSLHDDETPAAAARRELLEETGIDGGDALEDCRLSNRFPIIAAWRHRYAPDAHYNREHVFRLILENRAPVRLNADEHLDYKWLSRDEAARTASSWTNRIAILALLTTRRLPAPRNTDHATPDSAGTPPC